MSKKLVSTMAALVLFVIPSFASEKVGAEELKSAMVGKTLTGKHHKKGDGFELTTNPDGTFVAHTAKGETIEGTWRFDGDKYCNQSENMRKGREGCHEAVKEDGEYQFLGCGRSHDEACFQLK